MDKLAFIYSDNFLKYRFGKTHPFNPIRLKLTYELINELNLFENNNLTLVEPKPAKYKDLQRVHSKEYVEAVKAIDSNSDQNLAELFKYNIGTGDNPIFKDMYQAASLVAGATLDATKLVCKNKVNYAMNIGGGLHHAQRSSASGFCIFNDIAVGMSYLRSKESSSKILYIDLDVHHGDGVQNLFYNDPNVFCLSFHEDGRYQFPGSGSIEERGDYKGLNTTLNVPFLPKIPANVYFDILEKILPKIFEKFKPNYVFTQFGVDTHVNDLLGHFRLTTHTYEKIAGFIHNLVSKYSNKWIIVGGGGYGLKLVPRAWTIILAKIMGIKLPKKIPKPWREYFKETLNKEAPLYFHDDKEIIENGKIYYHILDKIEKII